MHGSYTRFTTILDTNHVSPRLRGAAGDTRRCRGEQHARKRTVEFETMLDLRDVSGSAARSRLPVGAFDDAHLVTRSSCRSVCSCSSTRGTRRPHGHALRCTSELLRRERSIGSTREFQLPMRDRRLSTRQAMDGSDGSTRDAQVFLRLGGQVGGGSPVQPALRDPTCLRDSRGRHGRTTICRLVHAFSDSTFRFTHQTSLRCRRGPRGRALGTGSFWPDPRRL